MAAADTGEVCLYYWLPIEGANSLDALAAFCPPDEEDFIFAQDYGLVQVTQELKRLLRPKAKALLVEFPYVDKDYRSTYYHYYAKKGRRYRLDSLRIHFFGDTVRFDQKEQTLSRPGRDDKVTDDYFGFLTLRPTTQHTIGRSLIDPRIIKHADGNFISSRHKLHLLGHDLHVDSFPWMHQHRDIAVCAHVACWAILRHHSERYRRYAEYLTHDVTRLAQVSDPGGLVPSLGLNVDHAERILSAAGSFPLPISHEKLVVPARYKVEARKAAEDRHTFLREMFAYLESGFPLFLAISNHAVVAVGYTSTEPTVAQSKSYRYSWDAVESILTVDDNHFPYFPLKAQPYGKENKPGRQKHSYDDISAYIVGLPDKLFYPAEAVGQLIPVIKKQLPFIVFPKEDDSVVRFFVTTAAALRRDMRKAESVYDPYLTLQIMNMPMAQFVWVVEFSTHREWRNKSVSVRCIIDATASAFENTVIWAAFDRTLALFSDRTKGNALSFLALKSNPPSGYPRVASNLTAVGK